MTLEELIAAGDLVVRVSAGLTLPFCAFFLWRLDRRIAVLEASVQSLKVSDAVFRAWLEGPPGAARSAFAPIPFSSNTEEP